jgi:hypothetical protein
MSQGRLFKKGYSCIYQKIMIYGNHDFSWERVLVILEGAY